LQAPQAPAAHAQCFQGQQTAQHGAHASRGSPPAAAAADADAAAASVGVVLAQYGRMSDHVHLMEAPLSARPLHALSPVRSWAAVLVAVGLPCAQHQTYTQAAMQKALKDPNMAAASSARGHEELGYLLFEGENTSPCSYLVQLVPCNLAHQDVRINIDRALPFLGCSNSKCVYKITC
jgi:hypothetical protein